MKIISLSILIFIAFISTAEARGIKIGRLGASVARVGVLRSVTNWTHSDYGQYCTPMPTEGTYLCEEGGKSDEMSFLEKQVSQTEQIIATTSVNEYSQASVDSYNFKVRALNDYIDKYNGILTSSCIDISKFCKEYEMSGKNTGSVNVENLPSESFNLDINNAVGIFWAVILVMLGIFMWRRQLSNSKRNAKTSSQKTYKMMAMSDTQIIHQDSHYREAVHKYLDLFTTLDEHMNIFREARKVFGTDDLNQLEEHIAENFIRYAKSGEGVIGTLEEMFSKVIDRIESTLGHESEIEKLYKDILDRDRTDKIT